MQDTLEWDLLLEQLCKVVGVIRLHESDHNLQLEPIRMLGTIVETLEPGLQLEPICKVRTIHETLELGLQLEPRTIQETLELGL